MVIAGKVTFDRRRESVGEWADEWYYHVIGTDQDGEEVEVIFAPDAAVERGEDEVCILWSGALDFEGTIHEAQARYPKLNELLLDFAPA